MAMSTLSTTTLHVEQVSPRTTVVEVKIKLMGVLLGCLLMIACSSVKLPNRSAEKDIHETPIVTLTPDTIDEIENYGWLAMPAGVQNIQFHLETAGIDAFLALRFEIPSDELPLFLEQASYTEALTTPRHLRDILGLLYPLDQQISNWPTMDEWEQMLEDPARTLLAATRSEPGFSRTVLVDRTNEELYIIYLVHHEL